MQKMYYRPEKVAEILGISKSTFWRLVKEEKIRTVKIGRRATGVAVDELNRFHNLLKNK